nr:uracil-DNA glycosylase [Chitinivorax tropicus]
MGLGPIWRLRDQGDDLDDGSPFAEALTEVETPAPIAPIESAPANSPGSTPSARAPARAPASPPTRIGTPPPRVAPPRVATPQTTAEALPLATARTAHIQQLDWPTLQQEIAGCRACRLCESRKNTVFGVGDPQADWLIVGEAPGGEEDRRGEPFVGPAGKLLDNMLASIGLKRGDNVFIANVLKCRPPQNRDPDPHEVAQCEPFLLRQIELIQPKIIIALGRFAAQSLTKSDARIGSLRGQVHQYHGRPLIITYHPAYLLRNLPDKAKAWEDLCLARQTFQQ